MESQAFNANIKRFEKISNLTVSAGVLLLVSCSLDMITDFGWEIFCK